MNGQSDSSEGLHLLSSLRPGDWARVKHIDGGRSMAQRMGMIGLRPGVDICVVHGPGKRGAVLRVGGAQLALGRAVIEQIRVMLMPSATTAMQGAES